MSLAPVCVALRQGVGRRAMRKPNVIGGRILPSAADSSFVAFLNGLFSKRESKRDFICEVAIPFQNIKVLETNMNIVSVADGSI